MRPRPAQKIQGDEVLTGGLLWKKKENQSPSWLMHWYMQVDCRSPTAGVTYERSQVVYDKVPTGGSEAVVIFQPVAVGVLSYSGRRDMRRLDNELARLDAQPLLL